MNKGTEKLKSIGIIVGSCVCITTGIWFFTQPIFEDKVVEVVKEYTNSTEFTQSEKERFIEYTKSPAFEKELNKYLSQNEENNNVSLRKLLSIKMGIPQEQVAEELSKMYVKDRKRLINLLKAVNKEHPEYSVWSIE